MITYRYKRNITSITTALTLVLSLTVAPYTAFATEITDVEAEIAELNKPLQEAENEYDKALDDINAANEKISQNEQKITEIENTLTPMKKQLSDIMEWEYKSGGASVVDILLGSNTITDFVNKVTYFVALQNQKAELINNISTQEEELKAENDGLEANKAEYETKQAEAQAIMDSIQPDLDALNEKLNSLREDQKKDLQYASSNGGGPAYDAGAGSTVADYALSRIGCPYVWGASGPTSFDCSGLVVWAYAQIGISLPHYTESLYAAADEIIPISESQPGDVLYRYGHVGIVTEAGGKSYVHAPTFGAYVRNTDDLSWAGFTCALRFNH